MFILFVIATLVTISLVIRKDKGSILGLILWLVTIAVWVLSSNIQLEYLIIALGTSWTILVLMWFLKINTKKERD